jgi:hypothetical protein
MDSHAGAFLDCFILFPYPQFIVFASLACPFSGRMEDGSGNPIFSRGGRKRANQNFPAQIIWGNLSDGGGSSLSCLDGRLHKVANKILCRAANQTILVFKHNHYELVFFENPRKISLCG